MQKKLLDFHNITSFIANGLKEWTTYLGIIVLLFGWWYHKEINQLIIGVLTSPELIIKIIDGLASVSGVLFIFYKQKK